jgi:hypothetical protein
MIFGNPGAEILSNTGVGGLDGGAAGSEEEFE